ncbi:MAG: hypothetical protein Kow0032_24960 [Methyloligellaceae bacterium]
MQTIRLFPLLAAVGVCLFVLKMTGLILGGGYVLSGAAPAGAQGAAEAKDKAAAKPAEQGAPPAPVAQNAKPPKAAGGDKPPAPAKDKAAADASGKKKAPPQEGGAPVVDKERAEFQVPPDAIPSGAELAILQSLSKRRKELEERARALNLRENLLKAAEKRVETRIAQLKAIEAKIEKEFKERDSRREAEYNRLVALYSRMKPKKAAQIFNRLNIEVLTELVRKMKPAKTSPILAAMDPAVAERVTMEIAEQNRKAQATSESLPKIRGESLR